MLEQKLHHGLPPLCTVGRAPPVNYFRPPSGLKVSMQRELARTNSRRTVNILPLKLLWLLVFTSVWQPTLWQKLNNLVVSFIVLERVILLGCFLILPMQAVGKPSHNWQAMCKNRIGFWWSRALGGNPEQMSYQIPHTS